MWKKQMFYPPSDAKTDEMAIDHTPDGFSATGRESPGSISLLADHCIGNYTISFRDKID